jgi:hypothetical protein
MLELERGPISFVIKIEELLEREVETAAYGTKINCRGRVAVIILHYSVGKI